MDFCAFTKDLTPVLAVELNDASIIAPTQSARRKVNAFLIVRDCRYLRSRSTTCRSMRGISAKGKVSYK
ncbi:MAG: hypothetical protein ACLUSP_04075 [Christensenellales bacterium]